MFKAHTNGKNQLESKNIEEDFVYTIPMLSASATFSLPTPMPFKPGIYGLGKTSEQYLVNDLYPLSPRFAIPEASCLLESLANCATLGDDVDSETISEVKIAELEVAIRLPLYAIHRGPTARGPYPTPKEPHTMELVTIL